MGLTLGSELGAGDGTKLPELSPVMEGVELSMLGEIIVMNVEWWLLGRMLLISVTGV